MRAASLWRVGSANNNGRSVGSGAVGRERSGDGEAMRGREGGRGSRERKNDSGRG